ncbi:hypothetical protein HYH02_011707 [Chlamydomonas schloesseri]|uniref:ERD4-related membrane protein n=1 Tax=Chlamydomonas schloesseri TaxID=2026947 RepID=A0A835T8Z0_9CHLO|nr:hypothetical protein HYH02_011707 [Chlamydomonas schloesseri]|eukprot:KAG2435994.1 hypothetical protein HYH02_011707 [Chlamydomonas schloesseri]
MAAGSSSVLSSFLLNLYICLGCFGAFVYIRNVPWARRFFAARRFATDLDLKPRRLPNGWTSWILPVIRYPEEDIIDEAGLDCAIYLRILRFGIFLFLGASVWCIIAVLPVNMTSGEIDRLLATPENNNATVVNGQEYKFTDFDKYSLSNVEGSSAKMWVHAISVYAVVLWTIWLLSRYNRESVLLRLMFLGNAKRGGPSHTVLLTDVPGISEAVSKNARLEREASKGARSGSSKRSGGSNPSLAVELVDKGTDTAGLGEEDELGDVEAGKQASAKQGKTAGGGLFSFLGFGAKPAAQPPAASAKQTPPANGAPVAAAGKGSAVASKGTSTAPALPPAVAAVIKGAANTASSAGPSSAASSAGEPISADLPVLRPSPLPAQQQAQPAKQPAAHGFFGKAMSRSASGAYSRSSAFTTTSAATTPPRVSASGYPAAAPPGFATLTLADGVAAAVPPPAEDAETQRRHEEAVAAAAAAIAKLAPLNRTESTSSITLEVPQQGPGGGAAGGGAGDVDGPPESGDGARRRHRRIEPSPADIAAVAAAAGFAEVADGAVDDARAEDGDGGGAQQQQQQPALPQSYGAADGASTPGDKPPVAPAGAGAAAAGAGGGSPGLGGGGDDDVNEEAVAAAATGGKLQQPRVPGALYGDALVAELDVPEPQNDMAVLPQWGVDLSPLQPSRRTTKRYNYDLQDTSLDAVAQARAKLKSGETPQQMIAREFALVYQPTTVSAVNMIQDTGELEPLVEEYNKLREQLEDHLDMLQLRLKLRKGLEPKMISVLGMSYGEWGKSYLGTKWFKKVDAVTFWLDRLRFLKGEITKHQALAAKKMAPSAFITLKTRTAQAISSNSMHHHNVTTWRVQGAPAPFEVIWKNLALTLPIKSGRNWTLWAGFWAMTLFFMIPVTLIQAMIEVPKLASIPVLGDIVTAPVVKQLLEAIVPGLALKVFLAVVPIILRIMAIQSGATSLSEVDFGVVSRFFLFQVVVVFFGNIIAGSFFNQVTQFIKNPTGVFNILGKAIPMTSTFFITYVITNGLSVKSLAFLRLPGFVIFWLLSKFAGSPRARQRMWMYQYTDNGTTVVDHTIVILIGLTFCCINPIVCPAAVAYFLVTSIGERYNNIYVFRRRYESAGKLWKTVYNQVMIGLYIMQVTMLGLLAIKKFKATPVLFPLLFFTIGCHISTLNLYRRPWELTALHDAADLDMWEAQRRREELLAAAKKERKDAARRRVLALTATSAEEGRALLLRRPIRIGKTELRLRRAAKDDAAALELTPAEQREIADMYKNPCFKVALHDLDEVAALAADLTPRMALLNSWRAAVKAHNKKAKADKKAGRADAATAPKPPPAPAGLNAPQGALAAAAAAEAGGKLALDPNQPPPEVTKYDFKPPLDVDDDDASSP